jgi:hypothetical protein
VYAGLSFQFLPDVPPMQDVRRVLNIINETAVPLDRDNVQQADEMNELAEEMRQAVLQENKERMSKSACSQRLIHISQLKAETKSAVEFPTSNEFLSNAIDALTVEKQLSESAPLHLYDTLVQMQRAVKQGLYPHGLSDDLRFRLAEANRYLSIYNAARAAMMDRFSNLCQLEGDVSMVRIPEKMRAMLKWHIDKVGDKPFTRGFRLFDPNASFFGNFIIKLQTIYDRTGKVIQPRIPILAHGLFSVYEWRQGLGFHLIIHGKKAGGKTFALLNILKDMTCIPGTLSDEAYTTAKADLTDTHIEDTIRVQDEVEEWLVDSAAGKKEADKVNQAKQAMTNGMLYTKTFQEIVLPNGEKRRGCRYIATMQNFARACVTNLAIADEDALSSRFHAETMFSLPVSTAAFNFSVSPYVKAEAVMFLHKLHFCTAWAKKAAMTGAIPQKGPNMQVWKDITMRMNIYFKMRNIAKEDGEWTRVLDKMECYARQMIYSLAQIFTFDLPSSPHYGKPFKPYMLQDMVPHLYCTQEIVLFTTTMMADEIIRDDNSNVLKAMIKLCGLTWNPDFSPFEAAVCNKNAPFRFRLNREAVAPDAKRARPGGNSAAAAIMGGGAAANDERDKFSIDLNWLLLSGDKNQLALKISENTNPHVCPTDVMGVLKGLCNTLIEPSAGSQRRYGYSGMPKDTFRERFARNLVPRHQLDLDQWPKLVLDNYAKRNFRRATSKLTNVDEEMRKTPESWDMLYRELRLTSEQILVAHILLPYKTIGTDGLSKWIEATMAADVSQIMPITFGELNTVAMAAGVSAETVASQCSWAQIKALCMAIEDEMFFFPDSSNKSTKYFECSCHGWQGDYREQDVPDLNHGQTQADGSPKTSREKAPVVEIEHTGNNKIKLYFNPCAIGRFDKQIIVDAWLYATLCDTFEPQKYMLGWTNEHEMTKFDVLNVTREMRDEQVRALVEAGESYRQQGLMIPRMGYINSAEDDILFSVPFNGLPNETFDMRARQEVNARSQVSETIESMDDRAAFVQHLAAGRPFHEPVQTPAYRREAFLKAWPRDANQGPLGTLDYPLDMIKHAETQKQHWTVKPKEVPHFDAIRRNKQYSERQALSSVRKRAAPEVQSDEHAVPDASPIVAGRQMLDELIENFDEILLE